MAAIATDFHSRAACPPPRQNPPFFEEWHDKEFCNRLARDVYSDMVVRLYEDSNKTTTMNMFEFVTQGYAYEVAPFYYREGYITVTYNDSSYEIPVSRTFGFFEEIIKALYDSTPIGKRLMAHYISVVKGLKDGSISTDNIPKVERISLVDGSFNAMQYTASQLLRIGTVQLELEAVSKNELLWAAGGGAGFSFTDETRSDIHAEPPEEDTSREAQVKTPTPAYRQPDGDIENDDQKRETRGTYNTDAHFTKIRALDSMSKMLRRILQISLSKNTEALSTDTQFINKILKKILRSESIYDCGKVARSEVLLAQMNEFMNGSSSRSAERSRKRTMDIVNKWTLSSAVGVKPGRALVMNAEDIGLLISSLTEYPLAGCALQLRSLAGRRMFRPTPYCRKQEAGDGPILGTNLAKNAHLGLKHIWWSIVGVRSSSLQRKCLVMLSMAIARCLRVYIDQYTLSGSKNMHMCIASLKRFIASESFHTALVSAVALVVRMATTEALGDQEALFTHTESLYSSIFEGIIAGQFYKENQAPSKTQASVLDGPALNNSGGRSQSDFCKDIVSVASERFFASPPKNMTINGYAENQSSTRWGFTYSGTRGAENSGIVPSNEGSALSSDFTSEDDATGPGPESISSNNSSSVSHDSSETIRSMMRLIKRSHTAKTSDAAVHPPDNRESRGGHTVDPTIESEMNAVRVISDPHSRGGVWSPSNNNCLPPTARNNAQRTAAALQNNNNYGESSGKNLSVRTGAKSQSSLSNWEKLTRLVNSSASIESKMKGLTPLTSGGNDKENRSAMAAQIFYSELRMAKRMPHLENSRAALKLYELCKTVATPTITGYIRKFFEKKRDFNFPDMMALFERLPNGIILCREDDSYMTA